MSAGQFWHHKANTGNPYNVHIWISASVIVKLFGICSYVAQVSFDQGV